MIIDATVRSGFLCPMCGKEMRIMSGSWYYENDLGIVQIECPDCNITVNEYAFMNGFKNGEAHSYGKLVEILKGRCRGVFEKV